MHGSLAQDSGALSGGWLLAWQQRLRLAACMTATAAGMKRSG